MCGIAGVYSLQYSKPERDLFQRLLLLNAFRGMDSTGVVRIKDKPRLSCNRIRAVIPSPEFIFTKKGSEFIGQTEGVIGMIGHTRAATKGSVTAQNAHPFEFPNVIGVHNGTIKYKFKGSDDYETDSEALYKLINDVGIEEALNEVAYSDPAYALVFIDKAKGTLNFIKNSKRPLAFTFLYSRTTLAWSSTRDALEFAIKSGGTTPNISGWTAADKDDPYFSLKDHQLLTVKLGHTASSATLKQLDVTEHTSNYYSGYSAGVISSSTSWIKGSDGQYRHPDAEKDRLARIAAESVFDEVGGVFEDLSGMTDAELDKVFPKKEDGKEYADFRGNSPTDLTLLPWLPKPTITKGKTASTSTTSGGTPATTPVKSPPAHHGTKPLSTSERDYKLSCGCFACGQIIDPNNTAELERVRWWSRDFFACGDCYEGSDGDWVRLTVDDTWPEAKTVN